MCKALSNHYRNVHQSPAIFYVVCFLRQSDWMCKPRVTPQTTENLIISQRIMRTGFYSVVITVRLIEWIEMGSSLAR